MAAVSSVHHTLPLPVLNVDKPTTSGTTSTPSHLQKKSTIPPLTPHSHISQLEERRGKSPRTAQLIEEDESVAERGYYLEQIPAAEDDNVDDEEEFEYHEVPIEDFEDVDDEELGEEDLEQAVRNINEKHFLGAFPETTAKPVEAVATLSKRPEVIDDYIRNYLSSKGMTRALEGFQNEWYELQLKGLLSPEDIVIVPDVYQRNSDLEDSVKKLRIDVEEYKEIANKARSTYSKLRKERDFHRMHHKRVVQEKNRLITDIKKLKKHYEGYEPTLKQLQHKYEVAMKERMLVRLERDRLVGKVNSLEVLLRQLEKSSRETAPPTPKSPYPTSRTSTPPNKPSTSLSHRNTVVKDAVLPQENRRNPYLSMATRDDAALKVDKLKLVHGFKAHEVAASAIKFHPRKMILATVSDDKTWKMWAFPSGELIMSGDGHKDWIGDCDFHPRGAHLATASGDCTVKVWDFSKGQSTLTLADHTQAVWSCAFHDQGDFLVSSSMDHTTKLWDLNTGLCKQTFRGHADSVNHVIWQPYTNTIVTASADKTVCMWDARSGICTQTLYGHSNSVSCTAFTLKADKFASCDASGIVKIWDGRQLDTELETIDFGPHPANKFCFDPTGAVIAVASNDGTVKMWNVNDRVKIGRDLNLEGGNGADPVQAVVFDRSGEFLVASGSEGSIRIYS